MQLSKVLFEPKYVSLFLSVLAICMSVYTFWKTEFYHPPLVITTGEYLNIGVYSQGNPHVAIPIAMTNRSNRIEVVDRVALQITSPNGVDRYLFEPYYYQGVDSAGSFVTDSTPIPVSVDRNTTAVKIVLFRSSIQNPFAFLEPGVYRLSVLSWTQNSDQPRESTAFDFKLDSSDIESLAQARGKKDTVRVALKKYEAWPAGPRN